MDPNRSPFFAKAPVTERVLGVQFEPLASFTNAHLGAFWRTLDVEAWPTVSDAPATPPQFEAFPPRPNTPIAAMFMIGSGALGARIRIRSANGGRVIQIQNGAVHYNWLGDGASGSYERFPIIQNEFLTVVNDFRAFVRDLGEWKPNQWEVVYLNHLTKGTVWNTPEDWPKVFSSSVTMPYHLHRAILESFSGQWQYQLESMRGRLYVELQHANKVTAGKVDEILALRLTARGAVSIEKPGWELKDGLEVGHDAIVEGFRKIASDAARKTWEER